MACCRQGDKPLSEPMMVRFPTHICVTHAKWVNNAKYSVKLFLLLGSPCWGGKFYGTVLVHLAAQYLRLLLSINTTFNSHTMAQSKLMIQISTTLCRIGFMADGYNIKTSLRVSRRLMRYWKHPNCIHQSIFGNTFGNYCPQKLRNNAFKFSTMLALLGTKTHAGTVIGFCTPHVCTKPFGRSLLQPQRT